jgi:DNA-binding transcriptional MerR regulator
MLTGINLKEVKKILQEQPESDLAQEIKRFLEEVLHKFSEMTPWAGLRVIEAENRLKPNPLLVWEAYRHCRKNNISVPEWVHRYLDDAAQKLLAIHSTEGLDWDIAKALGLKTDGGKGTYFSRYKETKLKLDAVSKVMERIEKNKEGVLTACGTVANEIEQEEGLFYEAKTISNWYYELREVLNNTPAM